MTFVCDSSQRELGPKIVHPMSRSPVQVNQEIVASRRCIRLGSVGFSLHAIVASLDKFSELARRQLQMDLVRHNGIEEVFDDSRREIRGFRGGMECMVDGSQRFFQW